MAHHAELQLRGRQIDQGGIVGEGYSSWLSLQILPVLHQHSNGVNIEGASVANSPAVNSQIQILA